VVLFERLRRRILDRGSVRVIAVPEENESAEAAADWTTVRRFVNVERDSEDGPYACPCCGFATLPSRGGFELCPVCFWEDDGQDDHDADRVRGGPNGSDTLTEARANFAAFGASNRAFLGRVRLPTPTERAK
jgi:hypothetical protein